LLALAFGVSREALVRRLEELKLSKPGTWNWFTNHGGITDHQARQVLGDRFIPDDHKAEANRPTSLRLGLLAEKAWKQDLLSEGQLARLLHLDRVEVRRMLDEFSEEQSAVDSVLALGE
jgi:hypothetical protein